MTIKEVYSTKNDKNQRIPAAFAGFWPAKVNFGDRKQEVCSDRSAANPLRPDSAKNIARTCWACRQNPCRP